MIMTRVINKKALQEKANPKVRLFFLANCSINS